MIDTFTRSLAFAFIPFVLGACGSSEPDTGPKLTIEVAPLELARVTDACYTLSVYAGADPDSGALVWSEERVCSTRYGDSAGSLSYVGTCDASGDGASSVRLVLEDLCGGGPCGPTTPGATSLASDTWENPCPAPDGCTVPATCRENGDTPVRFDLVILRSAQQGFFDIAVEFSDVFCSGKVDCVGADDLPLTLLHDPDSGKRGPTVVVAWACTAGPEADTWLYYDNLVVSCYTPGGALIGAWPYDPSLGPGNAGAGSAPFVFQSASYRTEQDSNGIASWNVAIGVRPEDLPGRCVLTGHASASEGHLTGDTTPPGAVYPYIDFAVQLSAGAGALSCTRHPLNGTDSGVTTAYTRAGPKHFSHAMQAKDAIVSSVDRHTCGDTIASLDDKVTFHQSPEGVTARIDGEQSPFYPLPADAHLAGCCGDPCCE